MIYQVQCQYIPGLDQIWVAQLTPNDPIYEYDNEPEADAKAAELQSQDPTGRKYRVVMVDSTAGEVV
jgi:hypothetical protein